MGNLQVRFLEGWASAMAPGHSTAIRLPRRHYSFHEKAGMSQVCFSVFSLFLLEGCFCSSLPPCEFLPLSQAAPVATLPSALFVERLSLGASWVYSIQ